MSGENDEAPSERVFDISEMLANPEREIESDWATVGAQPSVPDFRDCREQ